MSAFKIINWHGYTNIMTPDGPLHYLANGVLWHGMATAQGYTGYTMAKSHHNFAKSIFLGCIPGEKTEVETHNQTMVVWVNDQKVVLTADERAPDSQWTLLTFLRGRLPSLMKQYRLEMDNLTITVI